MIDNAVRAGACGAWEAWHMTPAEMLLAAEALRKRREEELMGLDTLAWLTGQYAAVALNAPGRYPARPNRIRLRAQGDDEMQRMMAAMARESGKEGDAGLGTDDRQP